MAGRLNMAAVRGGFSSQSATTPPPPQPPVANTPGKFGVVQDAGTVGFTLDGLQRRLIDVSRFAGTPSLTLGRGQIRSRLTLAGAKLPGTNVQVDFVVPIGETGPSGTPAEFTLTLGGIACAGDPGKLAGRSRCAAVAGDTERRVSQHV